MPRRSSIHEKKILTLPTNVNNKQPVIYSQPPSLFQTIKEGVAFGAGSSIGHRIVGAIMGPSTVQTYVQSKDKKQDEYELCLKEHDDKAACQRILDSDRN